MTIPTLVSSYEKKVAVTRLQKFYSSINQAIRFSEIENGPFSEWDAAPWADGQELEKWYDKYLDKHLRILSKDYSGKYLRLGFADGSGVNVYGIHWFFCIKFKQCRVENYDGKTQFIFRTKDTGIEPYIDHDWDGSREKIIRGSEHSCKKNVSYGNCAKLIQYDGWKISDDYPW